MVSPVLGAIMNSQTLGVRKGLILGGGLFATGIAGGIILSEPIFSVIALLGILIAISSLAIFGFIIPLLE